MGKIVHIGLDGWLARSRREVLKTTGAEITDCSPDEIPDCGDANSPYQLAVICHSVPKRIRKLVSKELRARWPGIKVLQVQRTALETARSEPHADAAAVGSRPEDLLVKARDLMETA